MNKKWVFFNQVLEIVFNSDKKDEPAEILLYDIIGKDPWTGRGVTGDDFKAALDEIPRDRDILLRINSKGGDVHEGMTIKNLLEEWPKNVFAVIDGIAASTSSWIPCNCKEVRARKDSQMFIHDAMAFGGGNADDLRAAADRLDKTSDQIAGMYAEKCGKSVKEMRDLMRNKGGTLFTGQEAKDLGLVDTIIEGKAVKNFTQDEISNMRNQISAFYNSVAKPGAGQSNNIMNKTKIIAILNKYGVTAINGVAISNETPEEHLEAALEQVLNAKKTDADKARKDGDNVDLTAIRNEINELKEANKSLTEANSAARKLRVTNEIELLITNDQLPASLKEKAIKRAMGKDGEEYLNELKDLPSKPPGGEPLSASNIEITSDSPKDLEKGILNFRAPILNMLRGNETTDHTRLAMQRNAIAIGQLVTKNIAKLLPMLNANTISADLKRIVCLQSGIRAFKRRIIALRAFSTVFANVPLKREGGLAKVSVPYYPLDTAAAKDFADETGYVFDHGTEIADRDVTINKRKYKPFNFFSHELARQPFFNIQDLMMMKAEQLGVDVFTDVLSNVTVANFGAAIHSEGPESFDSDDVITIGGTCDEADWPDVGRSLILDTPYHTNLKKDPAVKDASQSGSAQTLREGSTGRVDRFDIYHCPRLPENAEHLRGLAVFPSALLVATAPIEPGPGVRRQLVSYELVIDPDTGLAFEYRYWGDADKDEEREVVECNYGSNEGQEEALKRITDQ
jgi:ATP-dependent protease ClpP protease subunit